MLKRLKSLGGGIFKWKVWLRIDGKAFHRHYELTPAAAQKLYGELLERRARVDAGLPAPDHIDAPNLSNAAAQFQRYLRSLSRSESYIGQASVTLAAFAEHLHDPQVSRIKPAHVSDWLQKRAEQKAGPNTRNRQQRELSSFFTWCVRIQRWMTENPALIEKARKPSQVPQFHTWSDYCAFADKAWAYRPHLALLIEVVADSGARISEIMAARCADVDVARGIWKQRVKGGAVIIRKAEAWMVFAAKLRAPIDPLCPREDGTPFKYHIVERAFSMLSNDAIEPHDLRHSRATWEVESGAKPRDVQERLGHVSLQTTEIYFKHAKRFLYDGQPRARDPKTVLQQHGVSVLHLCSKIIRKQQIDPLIHKARQRRARVIKSTAAKAYDANRYLVKTKAR